MPSAHNERRVNYRQEVFLCSVSSGPWQVLRKWLLMTLWGIIGHRDSEEDNPMWI